MSFKEFYITESIRDIIRFAQEKHKGQVRKFSGKEYFVHPSSVAKLVNKFTKDKDLVAAAYLHDTLEDTNATEKELRENFGKTITDLVKELTSSDEGIKRLGKAKFLLDKMSKMSEGALTVKLCDRLDNVKDLDTGSAKFKDKYTKETNFILDNLKRKLTPVQKKIIKEIRKKVQ